MDVKRRKNESAKDYLSRAYIEGGYEILREW